MVAGGGWWWLAVAVDVTAAVAAGAGGRDVVTAIGQCPAASAAILTQAAGKPTPLTGLPRLRCSQAAGNHTGRALSVLSLSAGVTHAPIASLLTRSNLRPRPTVRKLHVNAVCSW